MIQRSPRVCWGTIGDDLLLWSADDRRLHVLNSTAANVWLLADEPTTIENMVGELSCSYGIDAERIVGDVTGLVERFLEAGLCVDAEAEGLRPPPIPVDDERSKIARTATLLGPFRALGVPLVLDVDDELLRNEISRILDPLRDTAISLDDDSRDESLIRLGVACEDGIWNLTNNGRSVSRTSSRPNALRAVLSECNAAPLRVLQSAVVFHAAAADLGDGLVMFPGVSNAGKSTLVTQLLRRGHEYLTDEAVAVDVRSLHAIPFHKAICLEQGSQHLVPELSPAAGLTATWDVDPRSVGPGRLSPGGVIRAIVFPTFRPDCVTEVRPLEPFDVMQKLISNAFDFDRVGQPAFDAMVRLANALPAYEITHAGGDGPLQTLENLFARPRRAGGSAVAA